MEKYKHQKPFKEIPIAKFNSKKKLNLKPGHMIYTRFKDATYYSKEQKLNRQFGRIMKKYNKHTDSYLVKLIVTDSSPYHIKICEEIYGNMPLKKEIIIPISPINLQRVKIVKMDGSNYVDDDWAPIGSHQIKKFRCHYCGIKRSECRENSGQLKKCNKCFDSNVRNKYIVRYCSRKCQKRDWYQHRKYCGVQWAHYAFIDMCD